MPRFEAKKQDGDHHRPHSSATARAPKSPSAGSAKARFERAAKPHSTSHKDGPGQHGPGHHGTSQHGSSHHGTSQHGSSHHGSSQHGSSHHGTSQHQSSHHGSSHHGPTKHHKEDRAEVKPVNDEKPSDKVADGDAPPSAASIRSRFEAATKGSAPVKRKVCFLLRRCCFLL